MKHTNDDIDPDEAELIAERRWQQRQHALFMQHFDCKDPEHPGCKHCVENYVENEQ